MKSQGGEVILEVEPHLQVVFGVESQGRDHSEVLGVESQRMDPKT